MRRAHRMRPSLSPRQRWLASSFIALLAVAVSHVPALAQRPYDPAEGFLVGADVPTDSAYLTCLTDLHMSAVVPAAALPCQVTEVVTMDTTSTWWWTMARYRRHAVENVDGAVDTLDIDELVLLAVDPSRDRARPVWHIVRDRAIEFITDYRWSRKRRQLLVAVDLCLNGTGGCQAVFLTEYAGDHWAVVEQTYRKELAALAPEGFRLHKGGRLDLETMTGEQPLAVRDDPNCCPSGLLSFSVWLDGRHLRLGRAEVVRPKG